MSLTELFTDRHIGIKPADAELMLSLLNVRDLDELVETTVPKTIRDLSSDLQLPDSLSEQEALLKLKEIASMNEVKKSMIGLGYYDTHTPSVFNETFLKIPLGTLPILHTSQKFLKVVSKHC